MALNWDEINAHIEANGGPAEIVDPSETVRKAELCVKMGASQQEIDLILRKATIVAARQISDLEYELIMGDPEIQDHLEERRQAALQAGLREEELG